MRPQNRVNWMLALVLLALTSPVGCAAKRAPVEAAAVPQLPKGSVHDELPAAIDMDRHYLFFQHGLFVERHGRRGYSRKYKTYYEYDKILDAFADRGFIVISEARPGRADEWRFAQKVAGQIDELLAAGIPANRITVMGHSKGGFIALAAASLVSAPDLNLVLLAACGKRSDYFGNRYDNFVANQASTVQGRVLSIYDQADVGSGTCSALFNSMGEGLNDEVVTRTGKGHGVFYNPTDVWMDPAADWGLVSLKAQPSAS